MRLAFAATFTLSFFMLTVGTARATDDETLLREGNALRRSGDDATALQLFQRAYELNKTPRALAQIGLAEQALGKWSAADKHLHQALASGDDPWIRKSRATIDAALARVATHVGQLEVSGSPSGAEVRVDGEVQGQLPLARPISVTAGGVAIEVTARGYLPIVRSTTITVGTLTREIFNLQPVTPAGSPEVSPAPRTPPQPAPVAVPSLTPPPDNATPGIAATGSVDASAQSASNAGAASTGSGRLLLVLAASGLSAGALVFGVIEHVSWQNKVGLFEAMTGCGTGFPQKGAEGCQALYDDSQRALVLAIVGYGASAAFATTAIILGVTAPDRDAQPRTLACAPLVGTTGVTCALRF